MKTFRIALLLMLVLVVAAFGVASAQTGLTTNYTTSITYQNVSTQNAVVTFQFYNEKTASAVTINRSINAGAGSSLFLGSLSGAEALPEGFLGSVVMGSNQTIVGTMVQIPQNSPVKNRPLSNGFSGGGSQVLLATILKNVFSSSSTFSIQNADTGNINITVRFFRVGETTPALTLTENDIPSGSAKFYEAAEIAGLGASFNGSAVVTAVKSTGGLAANIVGSVLELGTNNLSAKAFEGIGSGSTNLYVATALCDAFSGTRTAYAVQNTDTVNSANVTVTYKNSAGATVGTDTKSISAGGKQSFIACDKTPAGFSGSAQVASSGPAIVAIAKAFKPADGNYGTAFLGASAGASKIALPYVRYTSDANFATGNFQRTFIAIQNIGGSAVANVLVKYLDKDGTVIGTHTIASIPSGSKANSNASNAIGNAAKLLEFGNPVSNVGGGFGGAVIIEGPAGSQLIAIGRVASSAPTGDVAEDYNGIPVQ